MKPIEMPLRETLFDLIYSGARGRMTNGDTYGVWFVNERNDTSFQMEFWKAKHTVELGAKAVSALKEHGLQGKARLDVALADALRIIKNVEDLTVILVSNGDAPIAGTPFDEEINARFREVAPELKRAKTTMNTALVAQDGKFVAWAVNSADFLLEIPTVAPKPKRPKVEVAVKTNAVTPSQVVAIEAPKARAGTAPIIITKESVAQERQSYVSSTANMVESALAAVSNTSATVVSPVTNNMAVAPSNTVKTVAVPPTSVPPTSTPPVVTVTPATKVEPTNAVTAIAPIAAASIPQATPLANDAPKAPPSSRAFLWVITGASLALACVFGVLLLWRGQRADTSLISQSLARERLRVS